MTGRARVELHVTGRGRERLENGLELLLLPATVGPQLDTAAEVVAKLLAYQHISEFLTDLPRTLRELFVVEQVSIKTHAITISKPSEKLAYKEAVRRVNAGHAVCDDRLPSQVNSLFFNAPVASVALVPLTVPLAAGAQSPSRPLSSPGDPPLAGVLALGSADAKRFAPELGVAHLDRLGRLAGICLSRLNVDAR